MHQPARNERRRFLALAGTALTASLAIAGCSAPGNGDSAAADSTDDSNDESDDGDEWVQTDTVEMTDELSFAPQRIQVEAGTTVTWENVGAVGHTVTAYEDEIPSGAEYFASGDFESQDAAADGYPDSGNITEGGTYEHTFDTPGEYKYYCVPHEMNGMVGWVKVV